MKIAIHIFCMACLLLTSCGDIVSNRYATYSEAQREGGFDRGWLPDIIPPSSKDIITNNDLDLNTSEGEFVYDNVDLSRFLSHLKRSPDLDDAHYEAYRYEAWVFYIHNAKLHCKYRFKLNP